VIKHYYASWAGMDWYVEGLVGSALRLVGLATSIFSSLLLRFRISKFRKGEKINTRYAFNRKSCCSQSHRNENIHASNDKEKTAAHLKLKYLKYDEVYYYLRILIN